MASRTNGDVEMMKRGRECNENKGAAWIGGAMASVETRAAELGLEPHEYVSACEEEERRRKRREEEGGDELEADFDAACAAFAAMAGEVESEEALRFYGLYKQATSSSRRYCCSSNS